MVCPSREFNFYVIQLQEPQFRYTGSDKYVCVPSSWIRVHEKGESTAAVKFPIEELSETKKRVERGEEYSKEWAIFIANVICGTNEYSDADKYIKGLDIMSALEQIHVKTEPEVISSISSMGRMVESMDLEMTQDDSASGNQSMLANLYLTRPEDRGQETQIVETADILSNVTRPSPSDTVDSNIQITRENPIEPKNSVRKTSAHQDNESELWVSQFSDLLDKSLLLVFNEALRAGNFKGALDALHSIWEDYVQKVENVHQLYIQQSTMLEKFIELKDQTSDLNIGDSATEDLGSSRIERDEHINNNANNEVTRLEVQNKARKFTLPPEYNPNNSRWTLKHRKKEKGVVELLPGSGIYVNANSLNNLKKVAKNSQTLARMLLVEIFRQNALCLCTITGRQSYSDPEGNVKPGLDKPAFNVLLEYVKEHARVNGWTYPETVIMTSLRNKLSEIKSKHG